MVDNNNLSSADSGFAKWWKVIVIVLTGIQTIFVGLFVASSFVFYVITREEYHVQIVKTLGDKAYANLFFVLLVTWVASALIGGVRGLLSLINLLRKVKLPSLKTDE